MGVLAYNVKRTREESQNRLVCPVFDHRTGMCNTKFWVSGRNSIAHIA